MTTSVVTKRRFSVKEYYMMADVGIFGEEDRVELVDGEIVEMAAIGSYHAGCVMCLNTLFTQKIGDRVFVNVQNPIQLDKLTVFQPDLAILLPRDDFYMDSHPTPKDVLLIIEVSDSSVDYDRNVKIPKYAQAGVPEVWQVNLVYGLIDTFSDLDPVTVRYRSARRYSRGQRIVPTLLPDITLEVSEILRQQE